MQWNVKFNAWVAHIERLAYSPHIIHSKTKCLIAFFSLFRVEFTGMVAKLKPVNLGQVRIISLALVC